MAAPERFAKRQIPLAPRAPSIHGLGVARQGRHLLSRADGYDTDLIGSRAMEGRIASVAFTNCKGDDDVMRNGRDRRSNNPSGPTRDLSACYCLGPISGSHQGQRPQRPHRDGGKPSGENRPYTWLHPNASQNVRFLLHRGRRPYMEASLQAKTGRIHGCTRTASAKRQIPLAPRAPSIHGPTRDLSACYCLGPISGSHQGQRPQRPHRDGGKPSGENRPYTWLHPNASQNVRFLLHRGRRPYMALSVISRQRSNRSLWGV